MNLILANLLSAALFTIGAVLLWFDKTGWGWFVFGGFLAMHTNSGE